MISALMDVQQHRLVLKLQDELHHLTLMIILDSQSEGGASLTDDYRIKWIIDRMRDTKESHCCLTDCAACKLEHSYKNVAVVWNECDVFFPTPPQPFTDKLHFMVSLYMCLDAQWIEYDRWIDPGPLIGVKNCRFMAPYQLAPVWSIEQIYEHWLTLPDPHVYMTRATDFIARVRERVATI